MDTLRQIEDNLRSISHGLSTRRRQSAKSRKNVAKSLGIETYSLDGSFALCVGEHPELPDVVIKVVPARDVYVDFAEWHLENNNAYPGFPQIHAVTRMDSVVMVVVEKIPGDMEKETAIIDTLNDEVYPARAQILEGGIPQAEDFTSPSCEDYEPIRGMIDLMLHLYEKYGEVQPDLHGGNMRRRANGEIVIVDPVF